jgi:uncharacterized protein involved in exopolysaccharide biosynthesis
MNASGTSFPQQAGSSADLPSVALPASPLASSSGHEAQPQDDEISLLDLLLTVAQSWRFLLVVPLLVGLLVLGVSFLLTPVYNATTNFLPPQQQQSAAASALASLGGLAGVAGAAAGIKSPQDQYIEFLKSRKLGMRMVQAFELQDVYKTARPGVEPGLALERARMQLEKNTKAGADKKSGMIEVEVSDASPERAAQMANQYVVELRRLLTELAVTEAQQRRVFFDRQMLATKDKLAQAQLALEGAGLSAGVLRAEPKAAAETYAKLRAEATAAEVKLQVMRGNLADTAPEVRTQMNTLAALRQQIAALEATQKEGIGTSDYIAKFREYKYQETLFELFTRQFELAKVDEAKEGALIQVLDEATPPYHKSKPKRAMMAVVATLGAGFACLLWVFLSKAFKSAGSDPESALKIRQIRQALRLRRA